VSVNIRWADGDPQQNRMFRQIAGRMAGACCGQEAVELWAAELHDLVAEHGPLDHFYTTLLFRLSAHAAELSYSAAMSNLNTGADGDRIGVAARHLIAVLCDLE